MEETRGEAQASHTELHCGSSQYLRNTHIPAGTEFYVHINNTPMHILHSEANLFSH